MARSANSGEIGGKFENVKIIDGSVCTIYTGDGYATKKTE